MKNRIEGIKGESWAQSYLTEKGYKILDTNVKLMGIEVDIIAEDVDGTIVFVEVKARNSTNYGHPLEAVTPYKQNRYRTFVKQYIAYKRVADRDLRFDVIGILNDEIEHIINAF